MFLKKRFTNGKNPVVNVNKIKEKSQKSLNPHLTNLCSILFCISHTIAFGKCFIVTPRESIPEINPTLCLETIFHIENIR